MRLPLSYAVRNIKRRPWHSLMTISGIAIVVFATVLMLSLTEGLSKRIDVTGEEENILVISRAGQNIMFSSIPEEELVELSTLPGVAQDALNHELISPETMHMSMVTCSTGSKDVMSPVYLRGVGPRAYEVHKSVNLLAGHLPEEEDQIIVGKTAYVKIGVPKELLQPGKTVRFEDKEWQICGVFEAKNSLIESEIWMQASVLNEMLRRKTYTFAVIRFQDKATAQAATKKFYETGSVERFFKGWIETKYYQEFGAALAWVFFLSILMVIVVAGAGSMIGANTMYTAVMTRMREIATYQILGFGKLDILFAFVAESLILSLIGGAIGVLAGIAINGLPLRLSYGAFFLCVDMHVVISGLALSVVIGIVGGMFPTIRGLRMTYLEGLRHV